MTRFPALLVLASLLSTAAYAHVYHGTPDFDNKPVIAKNDESGIKEIISTEYQARYRKWKQELLGTDYGRTLWNSYADRKDFLLIIKVVGNRKFGAGTDDFEWDADGQLVAATITLGKNLDSGFPDPVYYPVMNSLATLGSVHAIGDGVLASTKLAHEIGHVSFTARTNSSLFKKQNKLMESYYSIFLKNGFDTRDARLVSLQDELGAQPIEIWEDREYWSEVSALKFLVERIDRESVYCAVMTKVQENVENHARNYKDRFDISKMAVRPICGN